MQTFIKFLTLLLIVATTLHAKNGDNLIGIGAKARGMGGTSIAVSHGADSILGNNSLITTVKGTEISVGGTLLIPTISSKLTLATSSPSHTSDTSTNVLPQVSIAHKINDNWYIGVGIYGTAGMGVDYSKIVDNGSKNFSMLTNLQLFQLAMPIAYKNSGFSISATPVVQYGKFQISFDTSSYGGGNIGSGSAQDTGFGYNIGLAYDFSKSGINGLSFGAIYKSSINMSYGTQISTAMVGLNRLPLKTSLPTIDELAQPSEYGVGLSYKIDKSTLALDYRKISWSSAKGYSDFGWIDSNVYAVGYEFAQDSWIARVGYNYSSSAIVELPSTGTNGANATVLNLLNLLGFSENTQQHYTVGWTYDFPTKFSVDLAYVYSLEAKDTFILGKFGTGSEISTSHKESSFSFQLNYTF